MGAELTANLLQFAKDNNVVFQKDRADSSKAIALLPEGADAQKLADLIGDHYLRPAVTTTVEGEGGVTVPAVRVDARWLPALKNLGLEVRDTAISPENVRKTPDGGVVER